ncbi:Mitochondrial outer membrane protein iml2 [Marasmius sp. AFHP31]|nr:Mitochondrial outer membrane protein iml2 [Marasmius sp. AFHP31]
MFSPSVEGDSTPDASPGPSHTPSQPDSKEVASAIKPSLRSKMSLFSSSSAPVPKKSSSFFGRRISSGTSTPKTLVVPTETSFHPNGSIEDMIMCVQLRSDTVYSTSYPLFFRRKLKALVGFFRSKHDRALALQVIAVSAAEKDPHSVFVGLVLMTYRGIVLLLSGYRAAPVFGHRKLFEGAISERPPMNTE